MMRMRIDFLERVLRLIDRIGRTRLGTIVGLAIVVIVTALGLLLVGSSTGLVLPLATGVLLAVAVLTRRLLLDETAPTWGFLNAYRAELYEKACGSALLNDDIKAVVGRSQRKQDDLLTHVTAAAEQTWSGHVRETSRLDVVNRQVQAANRIDTLLDRRRLAARLWAALVVMAGVGLLTSWYTRLPRPEDFLVQRSPQLLTGSLLVVVGAILLLAVRSWRKPLAQVPPKLDSAIVALDLWQLLL